MKCLNFSVVQRIDSLLFKFFKMVFHGLSSVQKITSRFIEVLTLADTLKMKRLAR
mgnify:CR=1 FL=1